MSRFPLSGIADVNSPRAARTLFAAAALAASIAVAPGTLAAAQDAPAAPPQSAALNASDAVPGGTEFLVRLNDELSTGRNNPGRKFTVTIVEPLETEGGAVLPPGSKIMGHITRIESAAETGRARIWLSFDDIDAPGGREAIGAEVAGVPGDNNVKSAPGKEGEIVARHGATAREAEIAAAGATVGAAVGGSAAGGRGVAEGAIAGGAIAFLAARNYAQEMRLPKGTSIELVLDRPLYITQP
jgi:hypothetical protein